MNLNVSVPLLIKDGIGELQYPEVFKSAPLQTHISCDSMYFTANENAKDEPCFIICSGSFYYTRDHQLKPNILGMFQNKTATNIANFSCSFPITSAQETLEIEIVDFFYKRQKISCFALFHIEGAVKNKLLTI